MVVKMCKCAICGEIHRTQALKKFRHCGREQDITPENWVNRLPTEMVDNTPKAPLPSTPKKSDDVGTSPSGDNLEPQIEAEVSPTDDAVANSGGTPIPTPIPSNDDLELGDIMPNNSAPIQPVNEPVEEMVEVHEHTCGTRVTKDMTHCPHCFEVLEWQ